MKRTNRFLFSMVIILCTVGGVAAQEEYLQDPRYGNNPDERRENITTLQFFTRAVRAESFDEALGYLRELVTKAPKSSENLYEHGIRIYKDKFNKASGAVEKKAILDTIYNLYEIRLENFSDHPERGTAYILQKYATDVYGLDQENTDKIYSLFTRAIKESGENVSMNLITDFMSVAYDDYKNLEKIETEDFLNAYEVMANALDIATTPNKDVIKEQLDNALISSGAADCDTMEELYKKQYEQDPDNLELTRKIVALMNRNKCGSDFLLTVTENYFKLDPSPQTALYLAEAFEARGENAKVMQYLKLAIDTETDVTAKSNLIVRSAAVTLRDNNFRQAADYARQAISINSENGYAYLILAESYRGGLNSACSDDFSKQAAQWLIVDILNQALRRLPAGDPQIRNVNSGIASSSTYFPNSEELFFKDIKEGSSYTVNCGWISGQTTVRARK